MKTLRSVVGTGWWTAVALAAGVLAAGCSNAHGAEKPEQPQKAAAPVACGSNGQTDCTLQGWMKATLSAYLNAGDTARLATALDELGRHAPAGYPRWTEAASAAAEAAKAGDLSGVRAQCKACHEENRSRYRKEMRTTRLF